VIIVIVKFFWGYMGKLCIAIGAIVVPLLFIFGWIFERVFLNRGFDVSIFFNLTVGICVIALGVTFIAIDQYVGWQLKKLKRVGKTITPIKIAVVPSLSKHTRLIDSGTYSSFRIECTFIDSKEKEIVVKSRRLVVCDGWLKVTRLTQQMLFEAVVYMNPQKKHEYEVETWII